jgi:hypothetical protein
VTKQVLSIALGMILIAGTVKAEKLSVSSVNGMPGETVTVSIDLSNLGPNDVFTSVDAALRITGGAGDSPELVGFTAATTAPYVWQPFSGLEFIPLTNCTDQQCVFGVIGHDVGVTSSLNGQVMDVEIEIPATATLGAVFNLDLVEDFSAISNGVAVPPAILPLDTPFGDGTLTIGDVPTLDCDFDDDAACTVTDIDLLTAEIATGGNDLSLDINRDGLISKADRDNWLSKAATENGKGAPYLLGDANLDGSVDALDLNELGQRWRQQDNQWSHGDFTADGVVNALDLNEMGQNWRATIPMTAAAAASVPEPSALSLVVIATLGLLGRRRRR